MDDVSYYCPLCNGKVLLKDLKAPGEPPPRTPLPGETGYCPSCEMLVNPVVHSDFDSDPRAHDPENPGRSRAGGSNAGGSQRGDLSDQGASQWRVDPKESERNTWQDKH